jgi:hypothetical protein
MHYQIEYYNNLWKDWIAFDQLFYKTEEAARKVADKYKQNKTGIKIRIIQTTILDEKPKKSRTKRVGPTVTVEKTRTTTWPH